MSTDPKNPDTSRILYRPLSEKGAYRFNPNRALPPRILAAPRFFAMVTGKIPVPSEYQGSFEECLKKIESLYPVVQTEFMEGGHLIGGGFWIHTIWSSNPLIPDVIVVKGTGDTGHFSLAYQYEQTRNESLLKDFQPIDFPRLN